MCCAPWPASGLNFSDNEDPAVQLAHPTVAGGQGVAAGQGGAGLAV
jgi:hypothetical protein